MTEPKIQASKPAPPRITHNSNLSAWFMVEHKITGRYPRVIDQVPVLELERGKLFKYGYNPSIIERDLGQGLLMAYRYHDGKTLHSDLALAQLDFEGRVLHNHKLALGAGGEDPKLFKFNGVVHLSWVESSFPQAPFRSVVCYGLLKDKGPAMIKPDLPGNDFTTMQKNWVFFGREGVLYCIYRCAPEQETYCVQPPTYEKYVTPGPRWPYGQIRGGSAPVPFEGNLLRFFHSGLDNEFGSFYRRYFVGAYLMRPDPPFEVLAVSSKPIVYGAEVDRLKKADWENCLQYKRQVVFPGGAVTVDGGWLVSVGVNDSAIEILRIKPEDLHLC